MEKNKVMSGGGVDLMELRLFFAVVSRSISFVLQGWGGFSRVDMDTRWIHGRYGRISHVHNCRRCGDYDLPLNPGKNSYIVAS